MCVCMCFFLQSVTPKTFTNVLLGNKRALKDIGTGRVLERFVNLIYVNLMIVVVGDYDNIYIYRMYLISV